MIVMHEFLIYQHTSSVAYRCLDDNIANTPQGTPLRRMR
jgi:hypothetical protein